MMNSTWSRALAVAAVAGFSASTFAQNDFQNRGAPQLGEPQFVGTVYSDGSAVSPGGDVVFSNFSPLLTLVTQDATELMGDDLVITEPGAVGSEILWYSMEVGGYNDCAVPPANTPFDVVTSLWSISDGTEAPNAGNGLGFDFYRPGQPLAPIAGTDCTFTGLPVSAAGTVIEVVCKVSPGIALPGSLFMMTEFDHPDACAGPALGDGVPQNGVSAGRWRSTIPCSAPGIPGDCPNLGIPSECADYGPPPAPAGIGTACHFQFPGLNQLDWLFSGFAAPFQNLGNWRARVVVEGSPWACCDTSTFACSNIQESDCLGVDQVFSEGTLCNNLNPPCSEGGACCDTATGACSGSFASECTGFLEVFTPGGSCSSVVCDTPDNVPTVTQWGMIVMTTLLLVGLTVKFGRRRTVSA